MRQTRLRSRLVAVCFLVCAGLALGCDWDQFIDPDPDQGLDSASLDGVLHMDEVSGVSDPEDCRATCCDKPDCDLVVLGDPAVGGPQCFLVRCLIPDKCVLRPRDRFTVYRKKVKTETPREATEGGESQIAPLLGLGKISETETNETSDTEANNIRCRLPMKVGSCRAAFPKFYYNVTSQSCQRFVYGGCEANGNNFDSQDECEAACSRVTGSVLPDESTPAPPQRPVKAARMVPASNTHVSQDAEGPAEPETAATESVDAQETERCGAEPQVGPCRAAFQRWYYNRETGSCQSFIYGGCRGNENNYISEESCMAACTVNVLPSSKKASTDGDVLSEYEDECTVTPDPGPCRAAFPMFYYNPSAGTCQSFIYGGCHGNQNRYGSMEACLSRCSTGGRFGHRGRSRNRSTTAIFLFVTLAAISALLLATLIVITMRRRNLSRRPSSVSDKEELLPDPDEQSSVESLTVPETPTLDKA